MWLKIYAGKADRTTFSRRARRVDSSGRRTRWPAAYDGAPESLVIVIE
ncbi:MAG: hypothetical protein ACRD21_06145 [Vicinamibacteria bacterium]